MSLLVVWFGFLSWSLLLGNGSAALVSTGKLLFFKIQLPTYNTVAPNGSKFSHRV